VNFCAAHLNHLPAAPTNKAGTGRRIMQTKRYWLDSDPVAPAVLVIGIGAIELLALSFCPRDLRLRSISRILAPSLISSVAAKSAARRRAGLRAAADACSRR